MNILKSVFNQIRQMLATFWYIANAELTRNEMINVDRIMLGGYDSCSDIITSQMMDLFDKIDNQWGYLVVVSDDSDIASDPIKSCSLNVNSDIREISFSRDDLCFFTIRSRHNNNPFIQFDLDKFNVFYGSLSPIDKSFVFEKSLSLYVHVLELIMIGIIVPRERLFMWVSDKHRVVSTDDILSEIEHVGIVRMSQYCQTKATQGADRVLGVT